MADQMTETLTEMQTNAAVGVAAGAKLERQRLTLEAVEHHVDGGRSFRLRSNGDAESLERWAPRPSAPRSTVHLRDADSFVVFVTRYLQDGTAVFVNQPGARITAVLDYHAPADPAAALLPGWGRFRAELVAVTTPEWQRWVAHNGKRMNQSDFAQFLEDNVPDIATPPGAEVVEMARSLEARKDSTFHSIIRATDGSVDFGYREDVQGTTRGGTMKVPDRFTLGIAPYVGVDRIEVGARLRYRIADGKLTMWYDLLLVEKVLEYAFTDIADKVESGLPEGATVLAGIAPEPQAAE